MYCKNCGKEIFDKARFCKFCGVDLTYNPKSNSSINIQHTIQNQNNYQNNDKKKSKVGIITKIKNSTKLETIKNVREQKNLKVGGICVVIMGVNLFLPAFFGMFLGVESIGFPFGLCSFLLILVGISMIKKAKRKVEKWNKYQAFINNRGNTNLDIISEKMNIPYMELCAEIQEMIDNEFFIGSNCDIVAYIDQDYHLLVMTKDGIPLVSFEESTQNLDEESHDIPFMQEYINVIQEAVIFAKSIKDNNTERYLGDIERITCKMINRIENSLDLQSNQDIIKWQDNYLPKTINIIEKYMDDTVSESTLLKIREMLHTCAETFNNLDEKLAQSEDIETLADIEVLKSTFARDGISDSDFDIELDV